MGLVSICSADPPPHNSVYRFEINCDPGIDHGHCGVFISDPWCHGFEEVGDEHVGTIAWARGVQTPCHGVVGNHKLPNVP